MFAFVFYEDKYSFLVHRLLSVQLQDRNLIFPCLWYMNVFFSLEKKKEKN